MPYGYTKFARPQGASFNPWLGRITVADLTTPPADSDVDRDDYIEANITEVATRIADRLDTFPPATTECDFAFLDAVEAFRDAADAGDVDAYDDALTALYDWGDDRRFIITVR